MRKETAIQLAANVGNLVVCSRTEHEINSVVKEIENINNKVNVLGSKCDACESFQVNCSRSINRQIWKRINRHTCE